MAERKKWTPCPETQREKQQKNNEEAKDCKIVYYTSMIIGSNLDVITVKGSKMLTAKRASRFVTIMDDLQENCQRSARVPKDWDTVPAVIVYNFVIKIGNKTIINQDTIKMNFVGKAHTYIASIIKVIDEFK